MLAAYTTPPPDTAAPGFKKDRFAARSIRRVRLSPFSAQVKQLIELDASASGYASPSARRPRSQAFVEALRDCPGEPASARWRLDRRPSALTIPLLVLASPFADQVNTHGPIDLPIASMMMAYDFTDEPNPQLATFINAANEVDLVDGSPQTELITTAYGGTSVTITIVPPSKRNVDELRV